MNPICFYHKADLDGVCSAAIVKHFVPDCELYGIDYHEEFPWDKITCPKCQGHGGIYTGLDPTGSPVGEPCECQRRVVYMVDFSLPAAAIERLAETALLTWVDHHKTAIDACRAAGVNPDGVRDSRRAACELTWWHFMDGTIDEDLAQPDCWSQLPDLPEAIRLLGAYDSWRSDDAEWSTKILPFQYGVRSIPGIYNPECLMWQNLCWNPAGSGVEFDHMLDALNCGRAVLNFQAEQNRKTCEAGARELGLYRNGFGTWNFVSGSEEKPDLRAVVCNTTVFNSQFFEGFFDSEKHDVMCAYAQLKDGRWKVSLYSTKPDIDCGAITKTFGGGGHRGAAGFTCGSLPWESQ